MRRIGNYIYIYIGKAIPIQAWTGPEISRRLRLPEFQNILHMKVVRLSAVRTGRLYPRKYTPIYIPPNIPLICIYIQGDQKVSVHLTITVHHQVHRDFLITLYKGCKQQEIWC